LDPAAGSRTCSTLGTVVNRRRCRIVAHPEQQPGDVLLVEGVQDGAAHDDPASTTSVRPACAE
jgi:hypothetical protein